jgi:hypothetical protein
LVLRDAVANGRDILRVEGDGEVRFGEGAAGFDGRDGWRDCVGFG